MENTEIYHLPYDSSNRVKDYTTELLLLMYTIRNAGVPAEIRLEKECYHFYPDQAYTKYYSPSNNDGSVKCISFPLIGCKNITIDGQGATLLMHGRITPFVIDDAADITVKNLTVDYTRPFYTEGVISDSSDSGFTLSINKKHFPHRVAKGRLIVFDENWENDLSDLLCLIQEFDPDTKAPARYSLTALAKFGEGKQNTENLPAAMAEFDVSLLSGTENVSNVRVHMKSLNRNYRFKNGNTLVICHEKRHNYGFFIYNSTNITLQNIRIATSGSMGVIAQLTKNITLNGIDISLKEDSKGLVTTPADATHFVNCSGMVVIKNCTFENMMDDGTNIHGVYTAVKGIGHNSLTASYNHKQQHGFNPYLPGDHITVIDPETLKDTALLTVKSAVFTDESQSTIRIEAAEIPDCCVKEGFLIENRERMPDVILSGNRTGNNRPRGFLITTPGKVRIENNLFRNSLFGIHISGDASYWFESGAVHDVLIQENDFVDCGYLSDGAAIVISPEFQVTDGNELYFHSGIKIVRNRFQMFHRFLLSAYSVKDLVFSENIYEKTDTYTNASEIEPVQINKCSNSIIEFNRV